MVDQQFYDVGNVYERMGQFYIAIDKTRLLTRNNEKFLLVKTKIQISHVNEISVEDLCEIWGIKINHFDKIISKFFQPDEEAKIRAKKQTYQLKSDDEIIQLVGDYDD